MVSEAFEDAAPIAGGGGPDEYDGYWSNVEGIGRLLDDIADALESDGNVMLVKDDA